VLFTLLLYLIYGKKSMQTFILSLMIRREQRIYSLLKKMNMGD